MFAGIAHSRVKRRGVVLIVVLGMLGLLALIGVTFATFSNQAQISSRNFSQSMSFPDAAEVMDFALSQLIDDTANPQSVIRGHSLKRDMYGNDAFYNGALLNGRPDGSGTMTIGSVNYISTGVHNGMLQCVTDISISDPAFYGYNFTRWVIKFLPQTNGKNYYVSRTLEILVDDYTTGPNRVFYIAPPNDATPLLPATNKKPASDPSITGYIPQNATNPNPTPTTSWTSHLSSGSTIGAVPTGVAMLLDGRSLRAFNGPGMSGMGVDISGHPLTEYANFRYNGNILSNSLNAGSSSYTPTYNPAFGDPNFPTLAGMDEDYDAADLENWFISLQSADGQIVVPSFHRPGILTAADWTTQWSSTDTNVLQANATRAMSKILRPRRADGHSPLSFPDLIPDATGKIHYDVDNDGDGNTDAVWLDLGYPTKRTPTGQNFKPLFAFSVIGLNGKLPLNTAGNLAAKGPGGPPYGMKANFDQAEHYGNSPSEVDMRFALQNAYDRTYVPVAPLFLPNYSQYDNAGLTTTAAPSNTPNGGLNVPLVQLRKLLAGSRRPGNLVSPALSASGDLNYVMVNGQPYLLPNDVADAGDIAVPSASGGTQVNVATDSVPGRWGEEGFIPSALPADPAGASYLYVNRIRAGFSAGGQTHDAQDDNFNVFDFWGTDATGNPNAEAADYYDYAGAISLPIERIRRYVTPIDLSGDGRVVTYNNARSRGGDSYGRVSFFKYFRPPGLPLPTWSAGVTAAPNQPAALGQTEFFGDTSNNIYHGFKSYNNPAATTGIPNPLWSGGMPSDVPGGGSAAVTSGGTVVPSYSVRVNTNLDSLAAGFNEADEMNLYNPTPTDLPFGASDLEWLYRLQDVDGDSLYSRLATLAPVSFLNPLDGLKRRRLFSLDVWETTNFVWANDNPSGVFPNNSRFTASGSASYLNMNNAGNNLAGSFPVPSGGGFDPDPAFDFTLQAQAASSTNPAKYPIPTPSIAHRDRRINLNFPLPVSNSPVEPVRQKWIRETYQFLKATLPPKSVDTPEELAQLSQYVVNVIDFRDPDCTTTRFVNTDVVVTEPTTSASTTQAVLSYSNTPDNLVALAPAVTYDPTYAPAAGAATHFLVQYGMEYPPVALNEVLAMRFQTNGTTARTTDPVAVYSDSKGDTDYVSAFYVELVNTLTKDAPASTPDSADLDLSGWDFVLMPDNAFGRPDPYTGQIPGQPLGTGVPDNIVAYQVDGKAVENTVPVALTTPVQALLSSATPFGANYFYVVGGFSKLAGTGQTAINPPVTVIDKAVPSVSELAKRLALLPEDTYYWLYLRRPPNPFDKSYDPANPNANRVVVDCFRFVYTTATWGAKTETDMSGNKKVVQVKRGNDRLFSLERLQPYRGGHAVPPLTGVSGKFVTTAYGYSEQTDTPTVPTTFTGYYEDPSANPKTAATTTPVLHTLGAARGTPSDAWDYLPFNDRDFTSVIELAMVPSCPPGLFTKQFGEAPPPIAGTTPINGTVSGTVGLLHPDTSFGTGSLWSGTFDPVQFQPNAAPHPFPYLNDEFYYTAASELTWPTPTPALPTGVTQSSYHSVNGNNRYIGGPSAAGWHKMFEFFEVPSQAFGAIGEVSVGTNYDWARADLRPGQINLNLVIDEEVFLGIMGESLYGNPFNPTGRNTALNQVQIGYGDSGVNLETPRFVTLVDGNGAPVPAGTAINGATAKGYQNMPNFGAFDTWTDPVTGTTYQNNAMKACFVDFLKITHGGSGYIYGYGRDVTGAYGQTSGTTSYGLAPDRPFHALSYPDIDYTILRPATIPPSAITTPASSLGATGYPAFVPPAGTPSGFTNDPGLKNPYLYTAIDPAQPPPIPTRRLFQVPDWWGSVVSHTVPSNAGETDPTRITTGDPKVNLNTYDNRTSGTTPFMLYNTKMDLTAPTGTYTSPPAPAAPLPTIYLGGNGTGSTPDQRDHPYFRNEWLQKVANLTTVRTHQYAVWITVGFFEVTGIGDPQLANTVGYTKAYDTIGLELGVLSGMNTRYRGFFLLDRTRAVGFNPALPGDFRDVIVHRQLIE